MKDEKVVKCLIQAGPWHWGRHGLELGVWQMVDVGVKGFSILVVQLTPLLPVSTVITHVMLVNAYDRSINSHAGNW